MRFTIHRYVAALKTQPVVMLLMRVIMETLILKFCLILNVIIIAKIILFRRFSQKTWLNCDLNVSGRSCLLGPAGHHTDDILIFANLSPCSLLYGDDNGRLKLVQAGQGRVTPLQLWKPGGEKYGNFCKRAATHSHTLHMCMISILI